MTAASRRTLMLLTGLRMHSAIVKHTVLQVSCLMASTAQCRVTVESWLRGSQTAHRRPEHSVRTASGQWRFPTPGWLQTD